MDKLSPFHPSTFIHHAIELVILHNFQRNVSNTHTKTIIQPNEIPLKSMEYQHQPRGPMLCRNSRNPLMTKKKNKSTLSTKLLNGCKETGNLYNLQQSKSELDKTTMNRPKDKHRFHQEPINIIEISNPTTYFPNPSKINKILTFPQWVFVTIFIRVNKTAFNDEFPNKKISSI